MTHTCDQRVYDAMYAIVNAYVFVGLLAAAFMAIWGAVWISVKLYRRLFP